MAAGFRIDINGLRAYAVVAVMLFHFGVPAFPGGYIGVDVFFVISGFLMTRIILERLEGSRGVADWPWVLTFYLARARRIVPALLGLCTVLLVVGWFTLPSGDYRQLGTHTVAALAFLSNIQFWREAGYFDAASHDKWLLHTWSVSVEWQFYLLFPLLLLALWRYAPGRRPAAIALAVGLGASLALSVELTPQQPSAAFYLLPTRAWELFAGGLVFLLATGYRPGTVPARLLDWVGIVMILGSAMLFSPDTPWPGALAAVPVAGTVLVLIAAREASPLTRAAPIQALGNWSYSIYLWHWPLVVALGYLELTGQPLPIVLAMALSILLGWLSWKWIENPARRRLAVVRPFPAASVLAALLLVVLLPAFAVRVANGFSGRLAPELERLAGEAQNYNPRRGECHGDGGYAFKRCRYGGGRVSAVLVGDSHASAVATAIQQALPDPDQGLFTFTYTACPTIFGVRKRNRPDLKCAEFNEWVMAQIAGLPPDVPVIIVNRSSSNVFGSNRPAVSSHGRPTAYFREPMDRPTEAFQQEFARRLTDSACRIAAHRPVYLVRPIPEMPVDVPRTAARKRLIGESSAIYLSLADYHERHALVWRAQDRARQTCGVRILDPLPWLCDNGRCAGLRNDRPLYYDSHHLSEYGNRYLSPMFREVFEPLLSPERRG